MTACSTNLPLEALLLNAATLTAGEIDGNPPILDTQESRWVRRAQEGDTAAFRSLVEAHQQVIHRLCLRWLHCEDDAREACQDTFLKAWQALPAWQPGGKLATWLYQIALNQCRDRAKSKASRQRRATIPLTGIAEAPSCPHLAPDQAASRQGDLEKLQLGLSLLPDSARAPLILCALEGLSGKEAAAILKCSPRALEGRLYRARQQLLDWWNRTP
jgi:RNA polymerase sigma factor (sigma-70 family)